ncbi:fructan 6-exohydrolase [Triticum dicoccoides]|uniref:fructan 6-exohydrolase n=1 Tax=Triticum dicoccoides TaxID=85692 RepID=UPI000E79B8CB|nr:fructan 6-exohydrolase [Triticum dicoccoides]
MAARLPLAACIVAFHLCLLLSPSTALRRLSEAESSLARHGVGIRPAYHFLPAKNWQNDPNGPMYHNGVYHMFYQYNPLGAMWQPGNLSWGHSVSRDLVNWDALDTALDPTAPFDYNGCWSGSATILPGGIPVLLYTGRIDADKEVQVQNVAFPKNPADPLLREWVKPAYNPVIPLPADVPGDNFRDPTTAWVGRDGLWRIAVAAKVGGPNGIASTLIYRSKDFWHWKRNALPLYTSRAAGMVECPDLFPVAEPGVEEGRLGYASGPASGAVRHVLKLSVMNTTQDYYAVGRYDDVVDTFVPEVDAERNADDCRTWRRFDYGHVYASKSFFDSSKNRRVLWAWANESDSQDNDIARGWSGVQTVPRKVWLDEDGKQVRQWPIEEIETLRSKRVVGLLGAQVNAGGVNKIIGVGAQADVEAIFEIPSLEEAETFQPNWLLDPQKLCEENGASVPGRVGPFGLLVMASSNMQEHTAIFFRVFRHNQKYKVLMCTDLTRSTGRDNMYKPSYGGFVDIDIEQQGRTISLRTLIDHSVVESFGGGGRTCITARVYPEHAENKNSHVFVFNNGTGLVKVSKLEAWRLAMASVNVVHGG